MSLPRPLMFTVGLVDQITKPIARISQQFNGLASNYQAGTMQMATGVGGMAAAGYALQSALMPAIEMDRVLGEVKSLDVRDSALKQLANTSYEYALKYGKSSTEFVSSSYDIQSAIAGLSDADLSQFTLASNVLATATKADAGTITNYMGTMYGIFKSNANAMGKSDWVNQVTGMTATAVQAFKTTGAEMSGAFTAIGAEAQSAGVGMHEQMAILGTLQATMSGSESGTKYKAFLAGVGKAQKALNLQFTNAQGSLLPMVDILTKIKGKYGETLEVAESDALAKAFGSSEAVSTVKLLMGDIDSLSGSINALGQVKGMGKAEQMAAAMTDQSERLSQSWFVIRAAFGSAVLPAFNEFVGWVADMGKEVLWFTQTFPNLTRVLGYGAIAILGLVAAGGLLTMTCGLLKMSYAGLKIMLSGLKVVGNGLLWVKKALTLSSLAGAAATVIETTMSWGMVAATKAATAAMWIANTASKAWALTTGVLSGVFQVLRTVIWTVTAAMLANPMVLVIGAAIVAVSALVYYWDDLVATMSNCEWVQGLVSVFSNAWESLKGMFIDYLNWYIDKLNYIPGVEIDLIPSMGEVDSAALQSTLPDALKNHNQQAIPSWMQQTAANDIAPPVPMVGPWMNSPLEAVSTPSMQQTLDVSSINAKPVANESISNVISPRINQQAAMSAQANRVANQSSSKSQSFGDVIIKNPPKNFSLAEIADQQELMTG
ncbi:phage tail tape measure protein [Shewanella sp. VB17]|uniref:phage tail tape measure protein n=1 Tax=Shewanella sp. VB17 TaxID=2739432 RepID=UPI0020B67DB7|nr:phage tail tape measure protein [Shewanella sp. VB17]